MRRHLTFVALRVALLLVTAGACTGGKRVGPPTNGVSAPPSPSAGLPGTPTLTGSHPCPGSNAFACSTLDVPLDHSGATPGTLDLQVAAADNATAPRGVLLFLTGGPGQPGVDRAGRIAQLLAPVLDDYRLVMLDQRGTGAEALDCPALQDAVGASDVLTARASAVEDCADRIGPTRRFYSTADTVEDLEDLRQALGVESWTLDGVSYGTFVAERYAIAHPNHVTRLVLDSVVPHRHFDPFLRASLSGSARVLRDVCRARSCPSDPAEDLAWVVRHGAGDVGVLNAIVLDSIVDPTFSATVDVPAVLHRARMGDPSRLDRFVEASRQGGSVPAAELSAGLHASTLCEDTEFPWGDSSAPAGGRRAKLARAASRIRAAAFWPFDRATAVGQGVIQSCLSWPATPTPAQPPIKEDLPNVPTLLLAGTHDLSTPLAWARQEAASAPRGKLVVVPGAGHSVQSRAVSDAGRQAVFRFLES
jgi:pimeloyl-ACP methyl ester carboxylesterase